MHLLRTLPLYASLAASAAASVAVKRQASSTSSAAGSTTTLTPDDPDTECTNTASSRQCWVWSFVFFCQLMLIQSGQWLFNRDRL